MANLSIALVKKSSAILKSDKFFGAKKEPKVSQKTTRIKTPNQKILQRIEKKVIKIDKILKDSLLFQKRESENKRRKGIDKSFAEKEKELEKKKPKEQKGIKLPSLPKLGLFDTIKNYIGNVIFGFFAVRLIDFLPTLLKVVPTIIAVSDFIIDIGGKILDGLITIIDWGYKAIDATRGFVGKSFGDDALKNFDKLGGLIDTFLNLAIIAGMLSVGTGDTGPGFGKGKSKARSKPGIGGRPKVTTSGGSGQGRPDIRNPLRKRPTVTEGSSGRSGFRIPGTGPKVTTGGGGGGSKIKLPKGLKTRGGLLGLVMLIPDLIESGMLVSQGRGKDGLRTFLSAIAGVGAGMLAASAVTAGAGALGITGVGIPAAIALAVAGFGASYLASSSAFNLADSGLRKMGLVDNDPETNKPYQYAGGGSTTPSTRGGKRVSAPATRYIGGKKSTRTIPITQRKVKPGSKVGGKNKLEQIFPDTKNPSENIITKTGSFIGNWISSLFGGGDQPSQDKKSKVPKNAPDPLGFLVKASDTLGKADFFGPIFSLATKTLLGDKPSKLDYLNVGIGLNSWLNQTMNFGGFAFAQGGEVDARNFMTGEDYSNVIAKSVENSVSGEVNQSIQDLMKQLMIPVSPKEGGGETGPDGTGGTGGKGGEYSPTGLQGDIYKYLLSRGLDDNKALGIMANISRESGFRPGASESGGPGVGLFQYSSGGRKSAFLKAVPNYATNWKGQIDYALKEDYAPQYLKQSFSSSQEAADVWMRKWERPAEYIQNVDGPKIHAQYLAGLQKYKTQKGYDIPGSEAADIGLGKGYGSKGSKIAGDLGRYLQKNLRQGPDFQAVTEHPEFGGVDNSVHAQNSYHKYGRAIDIGAYANEQGPILKVIAQFNKERGVKPVELLKAGDAGHDNHVHVAYRHGGETLGYPHLAEMGEEGKEYVLKGKSYTATEKVVPGLLDILNYDVNDKSSLIKHMPNIIASLSKYAPYENGAESFAVIPDTDNTANASPSSGGSGVPIISGGGGVNSDMQVEDSLMYG